MSMFLIFAGTLAQAEQGTWEAMRNYFRTFLAWIELGLFLPQGYNEVSFSVPFPGGFVLIVLMLINLVAAHVARFKFTRRRTGVLLIHAGLILLLGSELATAALAREGNMSINEGSYANYIERTREYELAVVKAVSEEKNEVTVVPDSHLTSRVGGEPVRHEALPFDVRILEWMNNSEMVSAARAQASGEVENPATTGIGTQVIAERRPTVAGTDVDQQVDAPSAYIELQRDGESLGTYLVTLWNQSRQRVTVGDETYELNLRFEREYKPYRIHLLDFSHDKFTGTEKPKNFSSRIRLVDPRRDVDRETLIYMNHPMYYEGETFYQASYMPDDKGTVLQVVHNPAWVLPYISCSIIAAGMVMQFGSALLRFLKRRKT
jgi:hypothetical protein